MKTISKIYIYVYGDSTIFPRKSQSLDDSWPYLLKDNLEARCGISVYLAVRGLGGATISEIANICLCDSGYYAVQSESISFFIINTGIVDAAPRPFTFVLKNVSRVPIVGPKLWNLIRLILIPNRAFYSRIHSYRATSPPMFSVIFNKIIKLYVSMGFHAISIDTPLTSEKFELRSPGLRLSIDKYNEIKHANTDVSHVLVDFMDEKYLLPDGHHFNNKGNIALSQIVADKVLEIMYASTKVD